MKDLQKYIGEKLKYYRKRRGFSKEEFARRTGVTAHTITNYEEGITIPDMEFMINASKTLNVSIDRILFEPVPEERYLAMKLFSNGVHIDEKEKQKVKNLFGKKD